MRISQVLDEIHSRLKEMPWAMGLWYVYKWNASENKVDFLTYIL
jgi:hypothetical protein